MNTGCTSLTLSMQFWTELVKQAEIDVETLLPYLFLQLIGRLASSHDCLVMWPILVTPVWGRRVQNQPTLVLLELSALLQFCLTLHNCGYWFWLYPKNIWNSYFLFFTCSDEGHCRNESTVLYHRFWSIKKTYYVASFKFYYKTYHSQTCKIHHAISWQRGKEKYTIKLIKKK